MGEAHLHHGGELFTQSPLLYVLIASKNYLHSNIQTGVPPDDGPHSLPELTHNMDQLTPHWPWHLARSWASMGLGTRLCKMGVTKFMACRG